MNQVQDVVLNEGGQQRGARRQAGRVRLLRPRLPGELRQQWQQLQVSVQIYPSVKVTKYREEDVPSGIKKIVMFTFESSLVSSLTSLVSLCCKLAASDSVGELAVE